MKKPIIPEWCKGLPNSTMLFSCDIIEFFNYKNVNDVSNHINKGYIPKPISLRGGELKMGRNIAGKAATNRYWLLGDIRSLAKELEKQA
jgi:hypothetical protein